MLYKSVSIATLFQLSASENIRFNFLEWGKVAILKCYLDLVSANLGEETKEEKSDS